MPDGWSSPWSPTRTARCRCSPSCSPLRYLIRALSRYLRLHLPAHLRHAGRLADLEALLADPAYIRAHITADLVFELVARLKDAEIPGNDAYLADDGSASPMVVPDGDVYFGVLEHNGQYASKGWLLHFTADLSTTNPPGAFGWDDTASIVDRSLVPSYTGTSSYLLMTKYNNYADFGLDGVNKIAILDPNATQVDSRTSTTVMKEVLTIAGVTPDPDVIEITGMDSAEVGKLAAAHGIALSELIPIRASLEEAFMERTRDSVEYQAAGASR